MGKNTKPEPPPVVITPRELRRQNMARFGSTMTPGAQAADPAQLAAGLNMCASAGLPDPVITIESITPPGGTEAIDVPVYSFVHFRVPNLQCKAVADEVALYPERIIQICKNAGIRADSLAALDDPPIETEPEEALL